MIHFTDKNTCQDWLTTHHTQQALCTEAILNALRQDQEAIALLLLPYADYRQPLIFGFAVSHQHVDVVDALLKRQVPIPSLALKWAAEYGQLSMVTLLLKRGADVHAHGDIALQAAAKKGHLAIVNKLLEYGANPAADEGLAYLLAVKHGHQAVAERLAITIAEQTAPTLTPS